MDFSLQAVTEAGRSFSALCEEHEKEFFANAARHDSEASFPDENIKALMKNGAAVATVPREFGGLGIVLMRDVVPGLIRLGRGDGSTAIVLNMHLNRTWSAARTWRAARMNADTKQEQAVARLLREIAAGPLMTCILATEAGTNILQPLAEAVRDGDGWRLNGKKNFATGSPAADLLAVRFRFRDAAGDDRVGMADIRRDAAGVNIAANWDGLGMRASGSHDVVFKDCLIPETAVTDLGPWGVLTPRFNIAIVAGTLGLAAAFLGIAETARGIALRQSKSRRRGDQPGIRHQVAEMEIDLAAARAILERGAANADTVLDAHPSVVSDDALQAVAKEAQCVKWFVMRKAVDIVDRAMTVAGGSSYLSGDPLSRLYRDVRAGPFMQPFSPIEAFEFIGSITVKLEASR